MLHLQLLVRKTEKVGLVAKSVISATDMLGKSGCMWLVCQRSLSETVDLHPHYAQGCRRTVILVLVTAPHMSVCGDNTTTISNDSVAWLGPMVRS